MYIRRFTLFFMMTNNSIEQKKNKMIWLDVLRIFACFSVVAVHISITFNISGRIGKIMEAGSNGLGIFYILSGFLAFYSLDRYKGTTSEWIKKKLVRILPMYYAALTAFIIIYEFILRSTPKDPNNIKWLSYVLGINTILKKGPIFWYNIGALSSMSVFMWFYVLAPLLKQIVNSWGKSLIFLAATYVLLRVLQHTDYLTMFRAYYYFAIGITTYYAVTKEKEKVTCLIYISVIMFLMLADAQGGLMYGLAAGLFIIVSHNMTINNETVNKIISFVSKRTFAIYIGHTAIIQVVSDVAEKFDVKCFILTTVLSIIAIAFLYEVVERGFASIFAKSGSKK